ncbi:hypothetical protein BU17DRAFT_87685 [Hysterangium stoloniferum]|nr:hypothetical protein BU17DRAFT_87685 [Hysterangium stoloniferum]
MTTGNRVEVPLVNGGIAAAFAFGILLWDHVVSFHGDKKVLKRGNREFNLKYDITSVASFILLRYSGILAILPALIFMTLNTSHCRSILILNQIGSLLVTAFSGVIFGLRTIAMWNNNKMVTSVVGFLYILMIACGCAVASQYNGRPIDDFSARAFCQILPIPSWTLISYASSVLFDSAMVLLALFKYKSSSISSGSAYHIDTIYFALVLMVNLASLVIQTLAQDSNQVKLAASSFSTVALVITGARIFVRQRQSHREAQVLPLVSTKTHSSSRKETSPNPSAPSPSIPPRSDQPTSLNPLNLSAIQLQRSDTPFGSYDYEGNSPIDDTKYTSAYITRETIVIVE